MAVLKINASRADLDRIVDGVALHFGYSDTIPDPANLPDGTLPNPQSKDEFTEQKLIEQLREWIAGGEGKPEQETLQKNNRRRQREIKALAITGT